MQTCANCGKASGGSFDRCQSCGALHGKVNVVAVGAANHGKLHAEFAKIINSSDAARAYMLSVAKAHRAHEKIRLSEFPDENIEALIDEISATESARDLEAARRCPVDEK